MPPEEIARTSDMMALAALITALINLLAERRVLAHADLSRMLDDAVAAAENLDGAVSAQFMRSLRTSVLFPTGSVEPPVGSA